MYRIALEQAACYYEVYKKSMCLAIPGKIEVVEGKKAMVNFGGVKRRVDLSFLEEAARDDWVLVHVGFALQKIDEASAREAYHLLADTRPADLDAELKAMS